MKAILALIVIYVGAFLLAIQGTPSTAVEAAPQSASGAATVSAKSPAIDPLKEADIRSLLELVGAHDQVEESVRFSAEQYREKLLATVPNNDRGQAFVNAVISDYEKRYDVDQVTEATGPGLRQALFGGRDQRSAPVLRLSSRTKSSP